MWYESFEKGEKVVMKCPSHSYLNDKQFAPQKIARMRKVFNSKGAKPNKVGILSFI